jgi:tetratricopeptide (TPR) repeat protein
MKPFLLSLLLLSPAWLLADVVHMKSGATLKAERCWEEGEQVLCRRAGGVIGLPKAGVERIESTPASPDAGRRSSTRSAARGRSRASSPPPPPPQAPAAAGLPAGGPEGWRARLLEIEESIGRPGIREATARREAAILHTLLGNEAARAGDLEFAESHYMRATDHDPALSAPFLNLARLRITQGRNDDAERLIQDALALKPEDPSALSLMGDVAYRSDRLHEAIDRWERSLAIRPDPELAARLEKTRKEYELELDFYRSDAPHFTLKYDGEKASEALSREILDHLETAYADLTSRFIVYPPSVIIVTLYSREAFHDITESPRWVGGLFDGQIRIPIGGLTRLTRQARSVFTHELAHCIVYHKTNGNVPRWLQEGIAQWVEGKSARQKMRSLQRKHAGMEPMQLAEEFSYPLSLALMERFLETWSFSHLIDLLDKLGGGSDLEAAFLETTGGSYEEFLASWLREIGRSGVNR